MKLSKQERIAIQELRHFKNLLGQNQTKWLTPKQLNDTIKEKETFAEVLEKEIKKINQND